MKRLFFVCLSVMFLLGCGNTRSCVDSVVELRNRVLRAEGWAFTADITADYGDSIYTFKMKCEQEASGDMVVEVIAPDSISGIKAQISKGSGQLTFEDMTLAFAMVADEQITPISMPWLFMKALCGGYISTAGNDGSGIHAQIDDSYSGQQFTMDIWAEGDMTPQRAELIWNGKRILSMDIAEFQIV